MPDGPYDPVDILPGLFFLSFVSASSSGISFLPSLFITLFFSLLSLLLCRADPPFFVSWFRDVEFGFTVLYQLPVGSQVRGAREGTLGHRLANTATRDC